MVDMEKEEYWSRFADDFEAGSYYVVGQSDMDIVLKKLAEQKDLKKTLELGCGSGIYSRVITREASELYATDLSDEMVAVSKERLKAFPTITVQKANCFQLSYGDGVFDTVFMANLLHIIPNPEKALAETKRVMKPGGTAFVISYTTQGMSFLHKLGMIYRYLKTWGKPSPYARTLKLEQAAEMVRSQGFDIVQSQLIGDRSRVIFIKAVSRKNQAGGGHDVQMKKAGTS